MPTTTSFPTANDSGGQADNWHADDGTTGRLRVSQTYIFSSFSSLSIPSNAIILGIEVLMEGYATTTTVSDDPLVFVSNDNGASFSDGKDASTEPWSTDSSAHQVEIAGGADDTWGLSWTPSSAAAIQVKFNIPVQNTAIFLDYVQVRITYVSTYPSDDNVIFKNGTLVLKSGALEIK
tara:strand:+ start:283 stop:816 length:534 start_codon:yes stop_codon:yes gene_type:complete